jgi:exopolysaccharide production protein ExoQ
MSDPITLAVGRETVKKPGSTEKLFAVSVLLYSTGAFLPLLQAGRTRDSGTGIWMGALLTNALWISVYCISLFLLRRDFKDQFTRVKSNWVILPLLGLATASILWSDAPFLTILRCMALYGTTVISLYFSWRYGTRELMNLSAWALGIAGACSIFFVIFFPRYGIGTGDSQGDWLGIYGQKNNLGAAMSIGFLISLLLFRFTRPRRYRYLFLAGFMLILVFGADSTSSIVICAALPVIIWITRVTLALSLHLTRRRIGIGVLAMSLVCVVALNSEDVTNALGNDVEAVINALGKDVTLSGRTAIWVLVYQAIQDKPILGYGYEAFWRGDEGPGGDIWEKYGQNLFYSHNGFLEVWLGLGLVGVMAFTALFVFSIVRTLHFVRNRFCLDTVWPWLFLCYLFLSNLTEATFMKTNTLAWILFSIVALGFSKNTRISNIKLVQ